MTEPAAKNPPARKRATKKPRITEKAKPTPQVLHPGDKLEMGISAAVKINGIETWVKVGGETTITDDETYKEAGTRLRSVVERYLDGSVKSLQEALS